MGLVDKAAEKLAATTTELKEAERAAKAAMRKRDAAMRRAVSVGVPSATVAKITGVTRGRVSQTAPRNVSRETSVPAMGETGVGGAVTRRSVRPFAPRTTGFYRTVEGMTLRTALNSQQTTATAERIMLVGPRDHLEYAPGGASVTARVRAWFLEVPDGWEVAPSGCYLSDIDAPIGRYVHTASGAQVEVMRAATWFGEDVTEDTCRLAWHSLNTWASRNFPGGAMLSTPGTTGRDLWQRTIGRSVGYQVLSDELRELIHATSGQGRIQFFDRLPTGWVRMNDGWSEYDGRLFYAAHCWGMPIGPPTFYRGADVGRTPSDVLLGARGRWRARVTVPTDWRSQIGVVGIPAPGSGWQYPTNWQADDGPGRELEGWFDAVELRAAQRHGWGVELVEGFTQREGKPLNEWVSQLRAAYEYAAEHETPTSAAIRHALRSMLLHGIGAFAARGGTVTRHGTERQADDAAPVRVGGVASAGDGAFVWEERRPVSAWRLQHSHPEWSATVWARARVKITDAALQAEREGCDVLAIRTDALYLAGDPQWNDDGKIGTLRLQHRSSSPAPRPRTPSELFALREKLT